MEIKEKIKEFIKENPDQIQDILVLISDNLKEYRDKVKINRDQKAYQAFLDIIPFITDEAFSKGMVEYLFEVAKYLFPDINVYNMTSSHGRLFMSKFMKSVRKHDYINKDTDWLERRNFYTWLKMFNEYFDKGDV